MYAMNLSALLLSNSTNQGGGYLAHADEIVAEFFTGITEIAFVPYALADHDVYLARVAPAFARHGITMTSVHTSADPARAIADAPAVYVGGGNTFRLTKSLQHLGLIDALRSAVANGTKYSGASAGSNVASPSLRTTNDMPIVQPASFETLGFLPFQLNCHYLDVDPTSTHAGETRELRLTEFLEENDVAVLGLREGTWIRIEQDDAAPTTAVIGGTAVNPTHGPAILFERGVQPRELSGDVSALMQLTPVFDA